MIFPLVSYTDKTVEGLSPQSSSTPVYEEVDVMRGGKCSQDIQLMSNEAYGPIMGRSNIATSPNSAYGQIAT